MPLFPSTLSRKSRPIGPVYNDTNRAARKLSRRGFDREAGTLALLAEQQKLAGGGSNITSAEGNRDERDAIEVAQSGLSRKRADVAFRADAAEKGLTVEATGAQLNARKGLYERMRSGITPEMKGEAAKLGITDSGFAQASTSAGQNRLTRPGAAPVASTVSSLAAPTSAAEQAADDIFGTPYAKPAAVVAAAKEAAEPARRLAMRAAEDKLTSTPQFGAAAAEQNIAKLGLAGAIADYKNRSAEAGKPPEPGNLAELKARDSVASPAAAGPVGPLQTALNEARTRRETRAITSGLTQSNLPNIAGGGAEPSSNLGPTLPGRSLVRPTPGITPPSSLGAPDAPAETPRFAYSPEEREKARQDTAPGGILDPSKGASPDRGWLHSLGATLKLANESRTHSPSYSPSLSRKREANAAVNDAAIGSELAVGGVVIGAGRKLKRGARDFRDGLSGR